MIKAYRCRTTPQYKTRAWLFTILGIAFGATHLFITEYLVGMELLRPVIFLILIAPNEEGWKSKIKEILKRWGPYLIILVTFIIWRLYFVELDFKDPNPPVLLFELQNNPSDAIINLIRSIIQDSVYVLVSSWVDTFSPEQFNDLTLFDVSTWGITVIVFPVLFWVMRSVKFTDENSNRTNKIMNLGLGLIAILLGLMPAWFVGRQVIVGRYSTRLAIPAMMGASIFLVSAVYFFMSQPKRRSLFLCILVGLAIGSHLRINNEFRWDWTTQKRTYWQIYWRAPNIQPDTAILTNKAVSNYASTYPPAFALNFFFTEQPYSNEVDYWLFEIYYSLLDSETDSLLAGMPLTFDKRSIEFSGNSNNSILVALSREPTRCVWILGPMDINNLEITEEMRHLAPVSNHERILPDNPISPPLEMFGPEPEHTWCYYFQKASLARQLLDWKLVRSLYQEALQYGYTPSNGYEYIPLIEATAFLGNWDETVLTTLEAKKKSIKSSAMLCTVWENFSKNHASDPGYQQNYPKIYESLDCESFN
jgi:hypothetical protein